MVPNIQSMVRVNMGAFQIGALSLAILCYILLASRLSHQPNPSLYWLPSNFYCSCANATTTTAAAAPSNIELFRQQLIQVSNASENGLGRRSQWPILEPTAQYIIDKEFLKNHSAEIKTIIVWSSFWTVKTYSPKPLIEVEVNGKKRLCFSTNNHSYYEMADALWFHGVGTYDLDNQIPPHRLPNQRWVVESMESGDHFAFTYNNNTGWKRLEAIGFNWSMSYTRWADIFLPFGEMKRSTEKIPERKWSEKWANFSQSFSKRRADAIFLVSDRDNFQSKRFEIVVALMKLGITVDVFGRMGVDGVYDPLIDKYGEPQFMSNYRFFLALENSLCEDYLTEKSFRAFYFNYFSGTIPIVHGSGNYSDYFPEGSYINTQDFETISQLAQLMKRLSKSKPGKDDELLGYYKWQAQLNPLYVEGIDFNSKGMYQMLQPLKHSFDRVCRRLWQADDAKEPPSTIDDIRRHFGAKCYNLPETYFDIEMPELDPSKFKPFYVENYNKRHNKTSKL